MLKLSRFLPKTESRSQVFYKKAVLKSFKKSAGKHICKSLFLSNVEGLLPINLLLKRLLYRRFPVNFAKYFTVLFSQSTPGRLILLHILLFAELTSAPKCYSRPGIFYFF